MSFGGTQGGEGALVVVARVAVRRCEPLDQQPHTPEDEFEVVILGGNAESAARSCDGPRSS